MLTLQDLRNGLCQPIHYNHEDTFYVPCFLNEDRSLTMAFEYTTADQQLAASFEPFYIFTLTGKFDCIVPANLEFYENHGNGD